VGYKPDRIGKAFTLQPLHVSAFHVSALPLSHSQISPPSLSLSLTHTHTKPSGRVFP